MWIYFFTITFLCFFRLKLFISRLFRPRSYSKSGHRKIIPEQKIFYRNLPKPPWVKTAIINLKAIYPKLGCRKIADSFNRLYPHKQMTVSKTYVSKIIRQSQYAIQFRRQKIKNATPKFVPKNLIWGMDLTGKTDTSGKIINILGIIEHHSRKNLTLSALATKSSISIVRSICDVIEIFGKPKIIRTDNESCFTSLFFHLSLFILGIKHSRTDIACPWQNGRIERFFGTLKEKLNLWEVKNLEQLNVALFEVRFWYNNIRTHQYLEGKTPAEVWNNVDIFTNHPKQKYWFSAWDGLLTGIYFSSQIRGLTNPK